MADEFQFLKDMPEQELLALFLGERVCTDMILW